MKSFCNFITISICIIGLNAQEFDRAKMDSLFSILENSQQGMGSLSIFKDGLEVYQQSNGFADVDKGLRTNALTTYRIGSISKTFTASLIMQLIEEGKLTLDTKLKEFFPEIPNADRITIELLLRHRSGIYNFTNAEDYTSWMEEPKTRAQLLEIFVHHGTVFEPDEQTAYSNTNYVLLTLIIEQIEKKEFAFVLSDRITQPLQLKRTYYGGKIQTDKNEALSYAMAGTWELSSQTDMSIPLGAGAIVSNPSDLNSFYTALFEGKVVSKASLKEMSHIEQGMGLGMYQIPFYNKKALGHGGGIDAFQSNVTYFQEDRVSFAYTTNGTVMPMNDILIGVLSIYFGMPFEMPAFKPGPELSSEDLDPYLGVYGKADFPLKVTISRQGSTLVGQATGQPSFLLEAYEKDKFKFDQAGLKLEFLPEKKLMILKQGGQVYELVKEETEK